MRLTQRLLHKKGFTLIELIMTIVLVGVIFIPLSLLMMEQIQGTFQSEARVTALNLARLEVSRVNNTDYALINSAFIPNYEGYNYDLTKTVTYVQGGPFTAESLKKIEISITETGSADVLVELITYITRNVTYGI